MDQRVETAIALVHRLSSEQISVHILSSRLNVSSARLRQLFKKEVGTSPAKYLKTVRLQRARKLLADTFLSVKQITHMCGINDVSHFVRDFKKQYGQTPSEFRVGNRVQREEMTSRHFA